MARIEADALPDPEQVYLGVDYATQVETLGRSTLFGALRHGAGFYVNAGQAEYCREALTLGGLSQGIVHREGSSE